MDFTKRSRKLLLRIVHTFNGSFILVTRSLGGLLQTAKFFKFIVIEKNKRKKVTRKIERKKINPILVF